MQISRWRTLWHEHPCQDLKGDSTGANFLGRSKLHHLVTPNNAGEGNETSIPPQNTQNKNSQVPKKNRKETTPESKLTIAGVLARKLVGLVWMLNFFPVWEGALSCFYSRSFFFWEVLHWVFLDAGIMKRGTFGRTTFIICVQLENVR